MKKGGDSYQLHSMFLHDIYQSHKGCEPDNSTQISCSERKERRSKHEKGTPT